MRARPADHKSRALATCRPYELCARDQRSRARATCGSLEPCTCDLGTTKTVCARRADHKSCAHATCGPLEQWARDLQTIRAVHARPAVHWSRVRAICGPNANPVAKNLKIQKSPVCQTFPSEAPGRALARTGAERGHRSTRPQKANKSSYKIIKSTTSSVLV